MSFEYNFEIMAPQCDCKMYVFVCVYVGQSLTLFSPIAFHRIYLTIQNYHFIHI